MMRFSDILDSGGSAQAVAPESITFRTASRFQRLGVI
jgi:hypothetical protein